MKLINIGYGNLVNSSKVVSVVSPDAAPIKRLIQDMITRKHRGDASADLAVMSLRPERGTGRRRKSRRREGERQNQTRFSHILFSIRLIRRSSSSGATTTRS